MLKKALSTILTIFMVSSIPVLAEPNIDFKISPSVHIHKNAKSSYQNGYTPNQIQKVYKINRLKETGKGQTIAIIEAYGSPTIKKDIELFNSKFNLPMATLKIAYPNGAPTITNSGWELETTVDVEWTHAIAPDATIMLVVAKSESQDNMLNAIKYATQHDANIVSMSWSRTEFATESVYDSYFVNPNTVFISSSGDSGSGAVWPASSPNVISVGGTTFTLDSNSNLIGNETAWSGSGGGISTYESEPTYQKKYGIKSKGRCIPDVAFIAYPGISVYDSTTGWTIAEGTSIGAPAWAGIMALVNQKRTNFISDGHSELYQLASKNYKLYYRDITSGSNTSYSANVGYDFITGLGSPSVNNLVEGLN